MKSWKKGIFTCDLFFLFPTLSILMKIYFFDDLIIRDHNLIFNVVSSNSLIKYILLTYLLL
jgi:hypothetical protein